MSKNGSRASILSAQLDFEAIDGSEPVKSDLDIAFDGMPEPPMPDPAHQQASPAPVKQPPPSYAPQKPVLTKKKAANQKDLTPDRFGLYAAIIVLLGFAVLLAIFFYIRSVNSNAAGLSYFDLPRQVVNLNGQVIRVQVTIQVRTEDREWLFENKKTLTDVFQIEVGKIDPEDLHSEAGFDKVRAQFKADLNNALGTDKVESVLINELLVQNHEQ